MIKKGTHEEHFHWNEENLPVYKCEKRELTKPSKYFKQANCLECDQAIAHEKGIFPATVIDGESAYSYVVSRPNSKAHCNLTTKRHVNDLREMNTQE